MYEKAGRRLTEPTDDGRDTGQLQLSIKHAKPVFGTDFDVIVEVQANDWSCKDEKRKHRNEFWE